MDIDMLTIMIILTVAAALLCFWDKITEYFKK